MSPRRPADRTFQLVECPTCKHLQRKIVRRPGRTYLRCNNGPHLFAWENGKSFVVENDPTWRSY